MASIGVDWWTQVVQSEMENDESRRENDMEEFDELFCCVVPMLVLIVLVSHHSERSRASSGEKHISNVWCHG